jgi:hypothetical protein
MVRERISSLQLFGSCNVTQLIPTTHYYDFLIHHMPDKYVHASEPRWKPVRPVDIARLYPNGTNQKGFSSGGKIKVIDEKSGNLDSSKPFVD